MFCTSSWQWRVRLTGRMAILKPQLGSSHAARSVVASTWAHLRADAQAVGVSARSWLPHSSHSESFIALQRSALRRQKNMELRIMCMDGSWYSACTVQVTTQGPPFSTTNMLNCAASPTAQHLTTPLANSFLDSVQQSFLPHTAYCNPCSSSNRRQAGRQRRASAQCSVSSS